MLAISQNYARRMTKRLMLYGFLGGWAWLTLWLGQTIYYHVPWVRIYPLCSGGPGEPRRMEIKGELDSVFEGYYVIEVDQVRKDTRAGGYFVPLPYWRDTDALLKGLSAAARHTWEHLPTDKRPEAPNPDYGNYRGLVPPCPMFEMYALKNVDKPWLQ